MEKLVGKTVRIVVKDYFADELLIDRVESFVHDLLECRTVYVQHMETSVVMDFIFNEDVGSIAMATKLSFAKNGVDVWLLP